jgi:hypothetical protein
MEEIQQTIEGITPPRQCIFCLRTEGEIKFSIEHVIPDSIGGHLKLDDFVCKDCNSWMGGNVDHSILKVHDLIGVLDKLGKTELIDEILKNHYDATLESESGEILRAHANTKKPILLPQLGSFGSMIYPEKHGAEALVKNLERQEKKLGLDKEMAAKEKDRIISFFNSAAPGEKLESDLFQSYFLQHSAKLHLRIDPKKDTKPDALIAKIAYEFMFFTAYNKFFKVPNLAKSLRQIIFSLPQDPSVRIFINRIKPCLKEPIPFHFIRLGYRHTYPVITVGFYGILLYELMAFTTLPDDFFSSIEEDLRLPKITQIEYQDGIDDGAQLFRVCDLDGKWKEL